MTGDATSRKRGHRIAPVAFLLCALLAIGTCVASYTTGAFAKPEADTIDARFRLRGTQPPPKDVAVIEIDDVTFNELDEQWPFPRSLHARVIDELRKAGASTIVYDVQFTEPTQVAEDNALIEAIDRAGNVVLASTEVDAAGDTNVLGGADVLESVGATVGNAIVRQDNGSAIRRLPLNIARLPGLAVAAAERERGRPIDPAGFDDGEAWIDFHGPPGTIPAYSFSRVADGRVPAAAFRDKVVVVGASVPSLRDLHAVPTSNSDLMSGAELQASAISTLLRGVPLRSAPDGVAMLLIVALGCVVPAASIAFGPRGAALTALGVGAFYVGAIFVAFVAFDLILLAIDPLLALLIAAVSCLVVHFALGALERQRVRDTFARFVPEAVVGEVLASTDGDLRLGGMQRHATVLFSDLRGFTAFAESREPAEVIRVLNRYLTEMSDAILDHGGTLVSYMGDGIMAVFGAPLASSDHADRALAAAREMIGPRLESFNEWLAAEGLGEDLKMGVGLNSGMVMSGNVGSMRRLEYTAIGDTTNTAARLEAMTKGTPHCLYVAQSTRDCLTQTADLFEVGDVAIRGRQQTIRVWTVS